MKHKYIDKERSEWLKISKSQQWVGLLIGLILVAIIGTSAYRLYVLAAFDLSSTPSFKQIILWASLGGILGGACRSIYKMSLQWGGHDEERPKDYFDKWFIYLLKPFVGMVGGIAFVLSVNLGLASVITSAKPEWGLIRVLLTSVVGSLFFEDVFRILGSALISSKNSDK